MWFSLQQKRQIFHEIVVNAQNQNSFIYTIRNSNFRAHSLIFSELMK